jgi:D-alanyl-D-alanine carboxypeptidase
VLSFARPVLAIAAYTSFLVAFNAHAQPTQTARVQAALNAWIAARAPLEGITGVAAYVSFGDPGPAIEAFAGKTGRAPQDPPVGRHTLFAMGSTSKSFTAAIILMLEADGKVSLDDTVGKYLRQYPAWKDVSIRRLLNVTSGIPNYSETKPMSDAWVNQPTRNLTEEELFSFAYPTSTNKLPGSSGYHYSNTNYILASMIAEKVTGRPFADLVHDMIIRKFGLSDTYYESGTVPRDILDRLAHGYFESRACADYQPNCKTSWNLPMVG